MGRCIANVRVCHLKRDEASSSSSSAFIFPLLSLSFSLRSPREEACTSAKSRLNENQHAFSFSLISSLSRPPFFFSQTDRLSLSLSLSPCLRPSVSAFPVLSLSPTAAHDVALGEGVQRRQHTHTDAHAASLSDFLAVAARGFKL